MPGGWTHCVATELCGFSYSTFRKKRLPRPVPSNPIRKQCGVSVRWQPGIARVGRVPEITQYTEKGAALGIKDPVGRGAHHTGAQPAERRVPKGWAAIRRGTNHDVGSASHNRGGTRAQHFRAKSLQRRVH